jgi:hypothetical protein
MTSGLSGSRFLSFEKEASTNTLIFVVRGSRKKEKEVFEKWAH